MGRIVKAITIPWLLVLVAGLFSACAPVTATSAPPTLPPATSTTSAPAASSPTTTVDPTEPATQSEPASAPTDTPAPAGDEGLLRLVVAPDGNEARYLVNEQLVGVELPSDAVGTTRDITGALVLTSEGAILSDQSKFVVDLRTLTSDSSMRDGFIQRSTLETGRFPTAEFVPAEARGLPSPLPTSGEVAFQLVGDLTVHGVTQASVWEVTAQVVDGRELVGRAATSFTFADFGMQVPRVGRVLSIADTIRLEYDFRLVRE